MARTVEMEAMAASARRIAKALRHVDACKAKLKAGEAELDEALLAQQREIDRMRYKITPQEVAELAAEGNR